MSDHYYLRQRIREIEADDSVKSMLGEMIDLISFLESRVETLEQDKHSHENYEDEF